MKKMILLLSPLLLALVSCPGTRGPGSAPESNPRLSPSIGRDLTLDLSPGQFVTAVADNTVFYEKEPKGDQLADKLFDRGTVMKVVTPGFEFVKVELDSGEVGYVPAVMVSLGKNDEETDLVTGSNSVSGPEPDTVVSPETGTNEAGNLIPETIDTNFSPD